MSEFIPNSTQIPNAIIDLIPNLSNSALRCYLIVIRQTKGWQKQKDRISISQFMKKTGLSRQSVITGCKELTEMELLIKTERKNRPSEYELNLSKILTGQKNRQDVVKDLDTQKKNKPTIRKVKRKNIKKEKDCEIERPDDLGQISNELIDEFIKHQISVGFSISNDTLLRSIRKAHVVGEELGKPANWIMTESIDRGWKNVGDASWFNIKKNDHELSKHDRELPDWGM